MPIYRGPNEISSGNFYLGPTEVDNGQLGESEFYVNSLAITAFALTNDAQVGEGAETRTLRVTGAAGAQYTLSSSDQTNATIANTSLQTIGVTGSQDTNVSIKTNTGSARSFTFTITPTAPSVLDGAPSTETVSQNAFAPNLSVAADDSTTVFSVPSGFSISGATYSIGGTCGYSDSGTLTSSGTSQSKNYSISYPACGSSCTVTASASKSGFDSGSDVHTEVGVFPVSNYTCQVDLGNNIRVLSVGIQKFATSCTDNTPATSAVSGSDTCFVDNPPIHCTNCIFSTGRSGGSTNVSCTSVPKNGTGDGTATCPALTGSGPTVSSISFNLELSGSIASNFFTLKATSITATRTNNQDAGSIGGGFIVTVCTDSDDDTISNTERDYVNFGNGTGHNGVKVINTELISGNNNAQLSGYGPGKTYNCVATFEWEFSGYDGSIDTEATLDVTIP